MEERTLERLKQLQALPLERKVGFTIARLTEFYNHFDGKVYVSFSGGKDSTVLLYIARKLFPDIKAVFVDTGLEYPEIREFVKTWDNVDWIRPKKSFLQVIKEYGYPVISKEISQSVYESRKGMKSGMKRLGLIESTKDKHYVYPKYAYLVKDAPFKISHMCCAIMKKNPTKQYEKVNKVYPIIGNMAEESLLRRQSWIRHGCNAFDSNRPKSNPMSFWTEQDVLRYIQIMNIPIASVYGDIVQTIDGGGLTTTGCRRTGCMFCMFGVHLEKCPNKFQRMYYTHPKQWDYCINKLGLRQVLDFINVPYEPIEEQPDLFNTEGDHQ